MRTKTLIILGFIFFFCAKTVLADSIQFYFIHPGGEGTAEEAKPYLSALFDYLQEQTGLQFDGLYLNDKDEAVAALQNNKVGLAIVSPEFLEKYKTQYNLNTILKTIPFYSSGPYEKYFIMANQETELITLADSNTEVKLYASKAYDNSFLTEFVFSGNDIIKKIPWRVIEAPNLAEIIKEIALGQKDKFVLLSGYEFSVINQMRKTNKDYAALQLIFSSTELPSSSLVTVGNQSTAELTKITNSLVAMPNALNGNMILKKLRLKGFAK